MATLSLDLRTRILAAYDAGEGTRETVAARFRVSLGMVKKLLQQRRRTGDLAARHRYSGRKPLIVGTHRRALRALLERQPDLTLAELRRAVALACSLPAIHYALQKMGLTYKKRHSGPASRTARNRPGAPGVAAAAGGLGPGTARLPR
jgi:transposase